MRFTMAILCIAAAVACNSSSKEKLTPVLDPGDSSRAGVSRTTGMVEQVTCPVCGLRFSTTEEVGTHVYDNTTYHFLIKDHMKAFAEHPLEYLQKEEQGRSR